VTNALSFSVNGELQTLSPIGFLWHRFSSSRTLALSSNLAIVALFIEIENTSGDDSLARAVERGDMGALTRAMNKGKVRVSPKGE
jgi:hypothetical protein